ncbi:MAG TPA: hypothetical protein VM778_06105 [Gemmatimonadota bacterium]|nr:hypothetical protein [Gemmatimonadota bacterium]
MTTKRRPRGAEPAVQGELEMAASDVAHGAPTSVPPDDVEVESPAAETDLSDGGDGPLAEALDGLDRRVTLLVERYEELAARHGRTLEERRADRGALERLAGSGASPADLDARIRDLEAENDRLARHSGFLEERIQGLLARVRYVIEA